VIWLFYLLRAVLFIFILALLFAYVIWPPVAALEQIFRQRKMHEPGARLAALAIVYVVLSSIAVVIGIIVAPQVAQQGAAVIDKVSGVVLLLERGQLLERLSQQHFWLLPLFQAIRGPLMQYMGGLVPYLQSMLAEALRFISHLWVIVLVPILAFFLLKDQENLISNVEYWVTEPGKRLLLRAIFSDVNELLAQYMRALIILSLLSFAAQLVFYFIFGVPYALLLASLGGVLEFIPLVGPLTAAITILTASWLAGYGHMLWLLIFLGVWRLVQDYINAPAIMGAGVEVHPLAVIFGILAGAELAGIPGMFLSVPAMATLRVLVHRSRAYFEAPPSEGIR